MKSEPLSDYLRHLEARGLTHVSLDEGAKEVLRSFWKAGKTVGRTAVVEASPSPASILDRNLSAEESLKALKGLCETWQPARSLGTLRETMVFAVGNPQADLMLVGEAPGMQEEREREPFVGPAGQKLNAILQAMGFSRLEVYISNICKFRPRIEGQTSGNRKPTAGEMASTIEFVKSEIQLVEPKVIVALGATAAQGLLKRDESVGALRGSWHEISGIPVRVTYHPSYLLHQKDSASEKRKVWEDMLTVMDKMKLSVSDKQRGYFLPK